MTHFNKNSKGFTLVEIGIVLAILGLLIGGILRGQELINSAKARNIIDQKSSIQTAVVAFSSRYKASAGDLTAAQALFIGNGVVASTVGQGNGIISYAAATSESRLVFQNLAATSFLTCTACMTVLGNGPSDNSNSPVNTAAQYIQYATAAAAANGNQWLDPLPAAVGTRNILTTGAQLTSEILQEVDIKADDGSPATGLFRQSFTGGATNANTCAPLTAGVRRWGLTGQSDCAGAWLF